MSKPGGRYSENERAKDIRGMVERTFGHSSSNRAALPPIGGGAKGEDAGGVAPPPPDVSSPVDLGPPVAAACPLGERPSGMLWHTVRWTGTLTLLVGPGVTLVLDAGSLDGIHAATGRAIASRPAEAEHPYQTGGA